MAKSPPLVNLPQLPPFVLQSNSNWLRLGYSSFWFNVNLILKVKRPDLWVALKHPSASINPLSQAESKLITGSVKFRIEILGL